MKCKGAIIQSVKCKGAIIKNDIFIIPTCGIMNYRPFGYPMVAIGFGWLCFRFKIEFSARKKGW